MLRHDAATGRTTTHTGVLTIILANRTVRIVDSVTEEVLVDTVINSGTGGSRFTTRDGHQFYLSADDTTLVFADLANGDGSIHIGAGVRVDYQLDAAEAAGTYNVLGGIDLNLPDTFSMTLDLAADGTYTVGGTPSSFPAAPGTWYVYQNHEIVLNPGNGAPQHRFVLSGTGGTLMQTSTAAGDRLFAIGNRAVAAPLRHAPVIGVPSVGAGNEGLVFIDRVNAPWSVADVTEESGGPSVTGELLTWFDARTGLARAAAATDRGLTVYSELPSGAWTYEVLSETLGTGTVLRPELAMTIGPHGGRNIVGLSTEGDLVRYVDIPGSFGVWREWNTTENQLEPSGLATPDYIGSIVAVSTSWGGLNIAGIDSNGDLVTVWTTIRTGRWFVSNLSDATGIGPLWSGLDGVSAGPHGIHFSAIDTAGKVTIVSWKPGDAGWSAETLTTSPTMQQGEISIVFDRATTSLYVATLRLDSGALVLHTLSLLPFPTPPPTVPYTTVSGFGVSVERRTEDLLDVQVSADGLISVYGINPDGETVRFSSLFSLDTDWDFENLTEIT
jgi:hypothetical protein